MGHISKVFRVHQPVSGLLAVTVRCCGDPKSDSVLTIHGLHRADEDIVADIRAHQQTVQQRHADDERAKQLMKTLGAKVEDCGCK